MYMASNMFPAPKWTMHLIEYQIKMTEGRSTKVLAVRGCRHGFKVTLGLLEKFCYLKLHQLLTYLSKSACTSQKIFVG